jgi:hypothetical protein
VHVGLHLPNTPHFVICAGRHPERLQALCCSCREVVEFAISKCLIVEIDRLLETGS